MRLTEINDIHDLQEKVRLEFRELLKRHTLLHFPTNWPRPNVLRYRKISCNKLFTIRPSLFIYFFFLVTKESYELSLNCV